MHKISRGPHRVLDPEIARLHHFKMPVESDPYLPYTIDDPVRLAD